MKLSSDRAAVLALLILSIAACNRRESSATATGTAESPYAGPDSGRTDSAPPLPSRDTIAPAVTAADDWSDANILSLLDEANMADSAAGAYAAPRAVSPDVKAFARLMMSEHHALRVQGQALAQKLNLTPAPLEKDPVRTAALSEMAALQGATKMSGFDRTYIEQEVHVHRAVLDLAQKAHDAAQSPELKKLIEQARPLIQKHLDRAAQIQKKLGKPTS